MNNSSLYINNVPIGTIDQSLIDECMKKRGFLTQEEALKYYFLEGWDYSESDNLDECLQQAQKEVAIYNMDSIAELMIVRMQKDIRPANEVCKNCTWFTKGFCAYKLCLTNPFEKGCEGWHEDGEEIESSNIATFSSKREDEITDKFDKANTNNNISNLDRDICRTKADAEQIIAEILKEHK